MKLFFIQPYHSNIFDTLLVLKNKFEPIVVNAKKQNVPPFFKVITLPSKHISLFSGFSSINPFDLVKISSRNDILLTKNIFEPKSLAVFFVARLYRRNLIVFTLQENGFEKKRKKLSSLLRKIFVPKKTKIICFTKEYKKIIEKEFSSNSYIPIPIDEKRFKKRPKSLAKKKVLKILTVSKFDKRKKISDLLHACSTLNISFQVSIYAAYNDLYKKELLRIKKLIVDLGLEKNVFIHLNTPYEKMSSIYSKHDIFVLPAKDEPLGYSVLEAMASGLPIICSDQVGAKSYVEEGKNGHIFSVGSISQLHGALSSFIGKKIDYGKINKFGSYSLTLTKRHHNPVLFLKNFGRIINSFKK